MKIEDVLNGTSIPSPSEVATILEEFAPELYHSFKTELAFSLYICRDMDLKTVRVHPRFENFAKHIMTPPFRTPSRATLHVDPRCPEYEMHLVYDDRVEVIEIQKEK